MHHHYFDNLQQTNEIGYRAVKLKGEQHRKDEGCVIINLASWPIILTFVSSCINLPDFANIASTHNTKYSLPSLKPSI